MSVSNDDATERGLFSLAYPDLTARLKELRARAVADGAYFYPPLEASGLAAWERRHGCVLPVGYRGFLLMVGNGAGGEMNYRYQVSPLPEEVDSAAVATPFSPPREWEMYSGGSDKSAAFQIEGKNNEPSGQEQIAAVRKAVAALDQGCLPLTEAVGEMANGGYSERHFLEVSGMAPGRVWNFAIDLSVGDWWSVTLETNAFFCDWLDTLWRRGRLV